MKRIFPLCVSLVMGICLLGALSIKRALADEGYNSWEAVRNFVFRSGEVRVRLLPEYEVILAERNEGGFVSWFKNFVTIKVGYEPEMRLLLTYRTNDDEIMKEIVTEKLNSWSRILIVQNKDGSFLKIENGILQNNELSIN